MALIRCSALGEYNYIFKQIKIFQSALDGQGFQVRDVKLVRCKRTMVGLDLVSQFS